VINLPFSVGILRNVSPIRPPAAASFVDIDKDIVLPLLQPVISSIPLHDASNAVQELLAREVICCGRYLDPHTLMGTLRIPTHRWKNYP